MYDTSEEEIDKCFTDKEGKPLVHNCEPMSSFGGMVYDECMSKAGNYFGNLVVFPKKRDMTMKNICHEAFHVLRLSMMCAVWKGCTMAEMSTRRTLWDGYVIVLTKLVWVLEILLRLRKMKTVSKEEAKKISRYMLGLEMLFEEYCPPYSRFFRKCLNS